MITVDRDLRAGDIQDLAGRDAVVAFFSRLGYDTNQRVAQSASALGITDTGLAHQIRHVERLVNQDGLFEVYLFEMRSLRLVDRQGLCRAFRNRGMDFLLVVTTDYDLLDFVLLERFAPEGSGRGSAKTARQVQVRPRVLTVDRRNPGPVALRVLRRFSYTEGDPLAQYDKLLSAYAVADWSEPLFNNRALFSDHYLKQRLPDSAEWREDPTPTYRRLQDILADARKRLGGRPESAARQQLLEPVFAALGFEWRVRRPAGRAGDEADYALQRPGDAKPLVVCLAYAWDRYLDGTDPFRDPDTPEENPGAQVVSLLEKGETPYAIVTNGKVWRLYAAAAHSRATNYYEIDLEETLASPDRAQAIRYFWLFFRAAAFAGRPVTPEDAGQSLATAEPGPGNGCFLDRLREEGQTYARELGERLKGRVFDEIFPHFAEGFIEGIRQREGKETVLGLERLDLVYHGTLTFLYRLMFVLYAEARDLLPVRDVHGYHDLSLTRLKAEVATAAGDVLDVAPDRLKREYRADTFGLQERLNRLFEAIDLGDASNNVPRYDGGLFLMHPREDDDTPEGLAARFLAENAMPDRFLALGLDRLARDLDPKTKGLGAIDFKSLGVRQLGSIYEGLLEFKLRIATEKMAVVKGKRTEEIVPYAQARKQGLKILTEGRGKEAKERTFPKGKVFLENNRKERKATGSYYTPDYIVEYIVEHAVGPVLGERFETLRPRLRQAEQRYATAKKNAAAKAGLGRTEDPEKVWASEDMIRLAYDVLDIKVLDPAMGSGHFLVEAVDFLTDRLLDFLNGFPHNPLRASLARTRATILESMEGQGVSIDPGRLTDVSLLRRQVLKRCVYGVDLNPMAVELAKVSLWLDAFTLGAPLSFLDHHLRWGNSLVGATAREVDRVLSDKKPGQYTLWGGPFAGLLRSAEIMRGIGGLADATMEQARESAHLFQEFEAAARPYKQLLDVYVIRHFGVKRAEEFLLAHGVETVAADFDAAKLSPVYQDVLAQRARLFRQYRFFHWDLEFPEVFLDLDRADWKENPGFDAVVGNPPWGADMEDEVKHLLQAMHSEVHQRTPDTSKYFIGQNLELAGRDAFVGMVVPNNFMYEHEYLSVRRLVLTERTMNSLVNLGDDAFSGAVVPSCLFVASMTPPREGGSISVADIRGTPKSGITGVAREAFETISIRDILSLPGSVIPGSRTVMSLLKKMFSANTTTLGSMCEEVAAGIGTGGNEAYIIPNDMGGLLGIGTEFFPPLIVGGDIDAFSISSSGYHILYVTKEFPTREYPGVMKHLAAYKEKLEAKRETKNGLIPWYCLHWPRYRGLFEQPVKLLCRQTADTLIAAVDDSGAYALNSVIVVLLKKDSRVDYRFLCSLMNSALVRFAYGQLVQEEDRVFAEVKPVNLRKLPMRRIAFVTPENRLDEARSLVPSMVDRALASERGSLLRFVDERMALDETDVVHDLLAFLAQQMIDMNKEKQAEIKRFLGWLQGQVGASLEDLSGRTIIRGYLGDYQKGEPHLSFEDLWHRLFLNRSKLRANLNDPALRARLEREYENSLGVLLPIKERLAKTDDLIDRIVYRLYGLTEEEIAIVEGRTR